MNESECPQYSPWNEQDPYPLATAECVDYDHRGDPNGYCVSPLSPFEGNPCPWGGYPKKEGKGT